MHIQALGTTATLKVERQTSNALIDNDAQSMELIWITPSKCGKPTVTVLDDAAAKASFKFQRLEPFHNSPPSEDRSYSLNFSFN